MKKRLLSLVLCLVMVFSLVPFNALALDRYEEKYESVGSTWNVDDVATYIAKAEEGINNTLYFKSGDTYYEVGWDTGEIYTRANNNGSQGWTPTAVNAYPENNLYYSSNKTDFYPVRTGTGTGYTQRSSDYLDTDLFPGGLSGYNGSWEGLHDEHYYFALRGFVKIGDNQYRRLFARSDGNLGNYTGTFFWYQNEDALYTDKTKTGYMDKDDTVSIIPWHTNTYSVFLDSSGNYGKHYVTIKNTNNGTTYGSDEDHKLSYQRTYTSLGAGDIRYESRYQFTQTLYVTKTIRNQIYYNTNTKLGEQAYDESYVTWTGSDANGYLYTKNGTCVTRLYAKNPDGTEVAGLTTETKRIRGENLLSEELYVKKRVMLDPVDPVVVTNTEETGDNGVALDKKLEGNANHKFDVTMTAWTNGSIISSETVTQKPVVAPMDIALVIDQSGSMATGDMGSGYAAETHDWTIEQATGGTQYYAEYNGTKYPVQYDVGYLYEKTDGSVVASDLIGWGDDAISLGANGAPTFYNVPTDYYVLDESGTPHKLFLITAGLFLNYGLYPYVYKSNSDAYVNAPKWEGHNYWVAVFDPWDGSDLRDNDKWAGVAGDGSDANSRVSYVNTNGQMIGGSDKNADSARLSYSWFTSSKAISGLYQVASTKAANQLYFVDASGERHDLGNKAVTTNTTVLENYTLYKPSGKTRVQALREAVTDFMAEVQQNAQEYEVDHRVALMGFAGNVIPSYSTGEADDTVGSNGLADYTNTGLYEASGFENYERITGYEPTTDQYINRHYYQKLSNGSYVPVRYMDGAWYQIDLATGAKTQTTYSRSNWYEATYEGDGTSLSAQDYTGAIMSVNADGAVNPKITDAIASFGANGGTYTSYGMTMAEQLYKALDDAGDTQAENSNGELVNRQRIIIVFTDGEPGANGYNSSIAGEALVSGNLTKTAQGAKVFTVGLFKTAPSAQVTDFMKKLAVSFDPYPGLRRSGQRQLLPRSARSEPDLLL